jgi:hypothetical protein
MTSRRSADFCGHVFLVFLALSLVPAVGFAPGSQSNTIALVESGDVGEPGRFALDELGTALRQKNFVVIRSNAPGAGLAILVGIRGRSPQLPEAECYSIRHATPESLTIAGSDERGLMYGILEVARRVHRIAGTISAHDVVTGTPEESGRPDTAVRGMVQFLHNADLEKSWYYDPEYWTQYLGMLARCRFNSFNLVFAHQTSYLAPPYPFLFNVEKYPKVQVPGLSDSDQNRNLETLRLISRKCRERGIDFIMGIWQHQAWKRGQESMVAGLTDDIVQDYSRLAIEKLLRLCPDISGIQLRVNSESGIDSNRQVTFYRDGVISGMKSSGRPVLLDLRGWGALPATMDAAAGSGLPMRLSMKYWAEFMGMPYQPARMLPSYSFADFLSYPRRFPVLHQVWSLGSHRLLPWGSVEWMKRFVPTTRLGGGIGFETCAPLSQKGFGNATGDWRIFADPGREYYRWEFERYWLYYLLYGRLSYDRESSEDVWMDEFRARFAEGAQPVFDAFQAASEVIPFLVSYRLSNPNMYIWPEKQCGGLLDFYIQIKPADPARFATFDEYVAGRHGRTATGKMMPEEASARLQRMANATERALERADARINAANREYAANRLDLTVLALLARYHARKIHAGGHLALFYATGDAAALTTARSDAAAALAVWEQLVRVTDGVYHPKMVFGPQDTGHWKDNLAFVRHDLARLDEIRELFESYGLFDVALDFGAPVKPRARSYEPQYASDYSVERRFRPLDPGMVYTRERGYGWRDTAGIQASDPMQIPYASLEGDNTRNLQLPSGMLYRDYLRSPRPSTLVIDLPDGDYRITTVVSNLPEVAAGPFEVKAGKNAISYVLAETGDKSMDITVTGGSLAIDFVPGPGKDWLVSGLVVTRRAPHIGHAPFPTVAPGTRINLRCTVTSPDAIDRATLIYTIRGGKPVSVPLTGYRTDFSADLKLPDQSRGREVLYWITAADSRGGEGRWPAQGAHLLRLGRDSEPPQILHDAPPSCEPGKPLHLTVAIHDRSPLASARLYYRHLTQEEDYRVIELRLTGGKGVAVIPGDFVIPRYDLQYYFEAVDRMGKGSFYPDPDRAAPYIVSVAKSVEKGSGPEGR